MSTYSIDLKIPSSNLEEFIDHLRTLGAAESIQFTIEAPNRRKAIQETTALLEEFSATYKGDYLAPSTKENIDDALKVNSERAAVGF